MPQWCRVCGYRTYLGRHKACGFPKCPWHLWEAEVHMRQRHYPDLEAAMEHYQEYQEWLEWTVQHASLPEIILAFGTPLLPRSLRAPPADLD